MIWAAAGVTVVGLAGVAGAISYSHMRALAVARGEAGWQAHTFPLSVDGIEIVASLVLLVDRLIAHRVGKPFRRRFLIRQHDLIQARRLDSSSDDFLHLLELVLVHGQ